MDPIGRRNFTKGLGVLGLLGAAVAGYNEVKERIVYKQDELPTKELEAQIDGKPVLQLQASYGEEIDTSNQGYQFLISPQYKPGTEIKSVVNLVPGPDGKLYVKENNIWRKI